MRQPRQPEMVMPIAELFASVRFAATQPSASTRVSPVRFASKTQFSIRAAVAFCTSTPLWAPRTTTRETAASFTPTIATPFSPAFSIERSLTRAPAPSTTPFFLPFALSTVCPRPAPLSVTPAGTARSPASNVPAGIATVAPACAFSKAERVAGGSGAAESDRPSRAIAKRPARRSVAVPWHIGSDRIGAGSWGGVGQRKRRADNTIGETTHL